MEYPPDFQRLEEDVSRGELKIRIIPQSSRGHWDTFGILRTSLGIAANASPKYNSRLKTKGIDQCDGSRKVLAAKPEDLSSILSWEPCGWEEDCPQTPIHVSWHMSVHNPLMVHMSLSSLVLELPQEFVLVRVPRWNLSFVTVIKLYLDNLTGDNLTGESTHLQKW